MRHHVLLASLAIATAACQESTGLGDSALPPASVRAHPLDLREERASLIAAGNAVSAAIASDGIVTGLGGALADDGLFLSPRTNTLVGRAAATEFLSTAPIAPSAMSWEVIAAEVSNDGSQGYTWAQGTTTIDFGTGAQTSPNFFLTYWRRGASDDWEIAAFVFNRGGPEPLPLPDGFGTPDNKHRRNFPDVGVGALRDQLLAVDADFSAASVAGGLGPAFEAFAAPNAIAVAGPLVYGPAAIGEAFASEPDDVISWVPRFADAAASGDLGFTVGDATFDLPAVIFYSKYLTVWQKQNTGEWRYVADLGNSRPAP